MTTTHTSTTNDLSNVLEDGKAGIVNGELVVMSPTGVKPCRAAGQIYFSLVQYECRTRRGYAFPDNAGFIVDLPNRESISPDAAFYVGKLTTKFLEGAPIFAVEVRGEGDYGPNAEQEMADKRNDYFAAGTEVVWDVDLLSDDVVRVYRACEPDNPTIYRRGDRAEAEPALSGWTMPVDRLFI